jgi:hypothetical protein
VVAITYLAIAAYSYYTVLNTFGTVPSSIDYVFSVIDGTGKELRIFPIKYGTVATLALMYSIFIAPMHIIFNFVLYLFDKSVRFYSRYALAVVIIYILTWIMINTTEAVGWYFGYVLD